MRCTTRLSRWLTGQLVLKYTQAALSNSFEMRYSTICWPRCRVQEPMDTQVRAWYGFRPSRGVLKDRMPIVNLIRAVRACEFFENQTRRLSRSEFDPSERVRIDLFDVPKG